MKLPKIPKIPILNKAEGSYQSDRIINKPDLDIIWKKSIEYEGIARNPVIVIHGFLGSHLKDAETGKDVWGVFKGIDALLGYPNNELLSLSHPMEYGKKLNELPDNVRATGLLTTVNIKLFGIHFKSEAYDRLIEILTNAGYNPEDKHLPIGKNVHSLFIFYYDWRRDIPENAARLHEFVLQKRKYMQQQYKKLYNIDNYDVI